MQMTLRVSLHSVAFSGLLCLAMIAGPASADFISPGMMDPSGQIYSQGTMVENGSWGGGVYSQGMMMSTGDIYTPGMMISTGGTYGQGTYGQGTYARGTPGQGTYG